MGALLLRWAGWYNSIVDAIPVRPIIVNTVEQATGELGLGGILLHALGLTGGILVASLLLGVMLGAIVVWFRRRRSLGAVDGWESERVRLQLGPSLRPN
jgi:hypothetical protein